MEEVQGASAEEGPKEGPPEAAPGDDAPKGVKEGSRVRRARKSEAVARQASPKLSRKARKERQRRYRTSPPRSPGECLDKLTGRLDEEALARALNEKSAKGGRSAQGGGYLPRLAPRPWAPTADWNDRFWVSVAKDNLSYPLQRREYFDNLLGSPRWAVAAGEQWRGIRRGGHADFTRHKARRDETERWLRETVYQRPKLGRDGLSLSRASFSMRSLP